MEKKSKQSEPGESWMRCQMVLNGKWKGPYSRTEKETPKAISIEEILGRAH